MIPLKNDPAQLMLAIWQRSSGRYFCISTKSQTGVWKDTFFTRDDVDGALRFIKANRGKNLYMCPHGFSQKRRHKDYAEDPNLLYADLDECDPRTLAIKPTIAIESSPGRYVGYWLTNKPASEALNQRLAYHIGSDTSGWDRTQVLRIPGTTNYKYPSKPTVRTLWADGPKHQVERLERLIPELPAGKAVTVVDGGAAEIYDRYEKDLPRWVRKELVSPRVQQGKRSEVLWKIICELLEVGMTKEEVFTVAWHSEWNKHADRRDGERQLEREIDKAMGNHLSGEPKGLAKKKRDDPSEDPTKRRFTLVTMDQVEEEQVAWIIPQMVARGQTTIFEGDPGVGKSYFLMWLAIHFCDGKRLPWQDRSDPVQPLRVVYCDMENSAGSVTKVRLTDNGLVNGQNYAQFTEPFSVDDEESIEAFKRDVLETFKPDIVIIDPVNLYIGGADTYRASETQQALQVLKAMSEEYQFALILVRHLNKSAAGKALYAGNGSIAFAGVARIIATVGWHPEQADMRVVACTKNNLSQFFGSLGYSIEPLPSSDKKKNRSRLVYEGHVEYSSDEIIGTSNKKEEGSVAIASDLIRELMKAGPEVNYHSLLKHADTRSISEASVRKAAAALGLSKVVRGRGVKRQTFLVAKAS